MRLSSLIVPILLRSSGLFSGASCAVNIHPSCSAAVTMPDTPSAATPTSSGPLFIPKETVAVVIGKQTVHIYPTVDPSMHIRERAHAFHITTTALQSLRLPSDVYLDSLGMYLDSATTVAGLKFDFITFMKIGSI